MIFYALVKDPCKMPSEFRWLKSKTHDAAVREARRIIKTHKWEVELCKLKISRHDYSWGELYYTDKET